MSYTPFNETFLVVRGNSNQDGIDTRAYQNIMQGTEIRDPLMLRRGILPKMGFHAIRVDQNGLLDNSIEINDIGQDIKASTTFFVDTTERFTPVQILQEDLAVGFLKELVTQQVLDEERSDDISVFEPYGFEIPFSSRGTKCSLNSSNPFVGSQLISSKYHDALGKSDFLDGQETILDIVVPAIQSNDNLIMLPYNDEQSDATDRFGINILNQDVDLYDRYASQGFIYPNNSRDSIAYGGLKD